MNGYVDEYGRALVTVSIRPSVAAASLDIEVWIDTGFNGDLVMPQKQIDDLSLSHSGTIKAILADGAEVALNRYLCQVDWFGEERELEVIANDGEFPLLGVGLLVGHDLSISYRSGEVTID
jgi:clan AA aspartic protease